MTSRTLLSEDKNGTKIFGVRCTCSKCSGTGIINCYIPVNGGECFDCGGSGIIEYTEKEYTEEYAAKLEARREKAREKKIAKAKAESAQKNAEFFERNGFNAEGKCWVVLGNTYPIKDELKQKGARYQSIGSKWYFSHPVEEYPTIELEADDFYFQDCADTFNWKYWRGYEDEKLIAALKKIEEAEKALEVKAAGNTEYFGEVGQRIEVQVKLVKVVSFESFKYSYYDSGISYLHTFKDADGHTFIWKTGSSSIEEGSTVTLKGTIKEHSEYKGVKQTVLTRCKAL